MSKPLTKKEIRELNKGLSTPYKNKVNIVFLLQDVSDPINVGSIFRVADAVGAKEVIMTGSTPTPPLGGISLTSRGLERRVPWRKIKETKRAIGRFRDNGYEIIGIELSENAIAYNKHDYSSKVCLVLGNEAVGIHKNILALCDSVVFIPMLGKGPSINVNIAGAIVAYQCIASKPG